MHNDLIWVESDEVISNKKKRPDGATDRNHTLQKHCTENSKQIFPEMKLRGLVTNFLIHISVSVLYIPTNGPPILLQKIGGPIVGIYKSLKET